MISIPLEKANAIISAVIVEGRRRGLAPLSVAVVDPGGHMIAFQREDGSSNLRPEIATAKACGALALGLSSRKIGEMAAERPTFVASLSVLAKQGIVPVAGGVIVVDEIGNAMGAVGVTGDTSDNDEACALAGITIVGFTARD